MDSEVDLVSEGGEPGVSPIPPEKLRVFPADSDIPADQRNKTIDESFVAMAKVAAPEAGQFDQWKKPLLAEVRRVSFGYFPTTMPTARKLRDGDGTTERLQSEEEIEFRIRFAAAKAPENAKGVLLVVLNEAEAGTTPDWAAKASGPDQAIVFCEPRGVGATKWTRKNPPNYVERCHALLGRTVDAGRVWDVLAAARYLPARLAKDGAKLPVHVAGQGAAGVIAAYAAVLDEQIAGVTIISPFASHMDKGAPQFLNILRVCDIPDVLGMLAPRELRIIGAEASQFGKTTLIYAAAGSKDRLSFKP